MANFPSETMEARRQLNDTLKVMGKNVIKPEFCPVKKYPFHRLK